jgi:hypothetical protein
MQNRGRLNPEFLETVGQWLYVDCHCLVNMGRSGVIFTYECDGCCNTNLRFIHTLEHEENQRLIQVGIECARALLDPEDWEIPGLAENEVKRKERWRIHYRKPGRCRADIQDLMNRGKL